MTAAMETVTMLPVIVLIAGVCGHVLGDTQMVKAALENTCYNVGSCTPPNEPTGDTKEICKIFEDSVMCMQNAVEACRQLDFPPETVEISSARIQELLQQLETYCSEEMKNRPPQFVTARQSESSYNDNEGGGHSEKVMGDMDNGSYLPALSCTTLVASLVLSSLVSAFTALA